MEIRFGVSKHAITMSREIDVVLGGLFSLNNASWMGCLRRGDGEKYYSN